MTAPRLRSAAAVVLALATGLVVWVLTRDGDGAAAPAAAATVSVETLRALPETVGHPVYWAGDQPGVTYEVTQTPKGRVYVRYLPAGAEPGADEPVLTVGTYPLENAFAATEAVAGRPGSVRIDAGPEAVAFYSRARPTSVYLASRGSAVQVEVFDPSAGRARELVELGRVVPVPPAGSVAPAPGTPALVSAAGLGTLARARGHAVYWVGEQEGVAYEVTQTPEGRIYVRYLPAGVEAGSPKTFLTVGTYPLTGAYAATEGAARQPGAVRLGLADGVAFYSRSRPTNVYLAYRGAEYQVEVYDPSPGQASRLVVSGQVRPVP